VASRRIREVDGVRRLLRHAGDGRRLLVIGFVLITVDAGAQILGPAVFRVVLNRLEHDPDGFLSGGWQGPAAFAVLVAVTFIVSAYVAHTSTRRGAARWAANLRIDLYEHVQRLSLDFFQRSRIGDLAARINQDIERLEVTVWHVLAAYWASVLLLLAVVLIAWVDPWMAALAVGLLAVGGIWTALVLPRLRQQVRTVRDELGATSGRLAELLSVNVLLKAFNAEDEAAQQVRGDVERVRDASERFARMQHRYSDLLGLHLSFAAPFALLFVGAWRIAHDTLAIGDLVGIWGFWLRGSAALTQLINFVPEVLAGIAAGDRAAELLLHTSAVADRRGASALVAPAGALAFDDVTFAYPGRRQPVLDGFDLHVDAGTSVALVGPSGVGKSTVVQLLLRFYDPQRGRVAIDGHDLRDVRQESVRAAVGVVFQENVLLSGTVATNLRLARPDASDDEVVAALRAANAWDFVGAWEDGIHTAVGERGVAMSGGQRQRLAIARVMLKDPAIVVLDESTSALDAESERVVLGALERLLDGRTSLVIAHRIATVRRADEIVVLQAGAVGTRGSHEELLDTSPTYRSYCETQSVR
jgi:ATP-binding cassette subfamily B protein